MRRLVWMVALVAVVLPLSLASATSLGTFDDVVLEGVAQDAPDCTAVADSLDLFGLGATVTTLVDDIIALAIVPVPYLSVTMTVAGADCVGMVPTLVIIGESTGAPGTEFIMARHDLSPLAGVGSITDLAANGTFILTDVPTEFRIIMTPAS